MAAAAPDAAAAPEQEAQPQLPMGVMSPPDPEDAQHPLLGKPTLVVLDDGRQVMGHLAGYDSHKNLILEGVMMKREFVSKTDGKTTVSTRNNVSISVPAGSVKGFYQREEMPESYAWPAKFSDE